MLVLQRLQTIDYIKNIISFGRMQIWRMQSHNLPDEAIIDFQSSHGGNSAVVYGYMSFARQSAIRNPKSQIKTYPPATIGIKNISALSGIVVLSKLGLET